MTKIILLSFTCLFLSCERDGPPQVNTISGIVSEDNTGTLVANETVAIYKWYNAGQHVTKLLMETTTDVNGRYNFDLNEGTDNLEYYNITLVDDERYFSRGTGTVTRNDIIDQADITRNLIVIPAGRVEFRIRNISPFDSDDEIFTIKFNGARPNISFLNIELIGMNVDTTIVLQVACNQFNLIGANITKNGTTTTFVDSVIVPSFGTINYDLNY